MKYLAPSLWGNDGGSVVSVPPKVTCETIDIQCVMAPCPPLKMCKDEKGNAVNEDGTPWIAPKPSQNWPPRPMASSPIISSGQSDPTKHPMANFLAAVGVLAVLLYLLNHFKKF